MWRIRDVYPGSRIRLFSIPDPGSRILIKEFKYFNPKKSKKWFLSSEKYDPGCSSLIPDPDDDFLPSRIPDPRSRGQKGTQSWIPDPDPQHWREVFSIQICTHRKFSSLRLQASKKRKKGKTVIYTFFTFTLIIICEDLCEFLDFYYLEDKVDKYGGDG